MSRVFLLVLCLHWAIGSVAAVPPSGPVPAQTDTADPEIDRSPIWARMYAQYLFFLGREMFWPDLAQRETFRLAVVNWPDLAEELGAFLEGRAIAGMPVELVTLDEKALASSRDDYTLLFLGGTGKEETLELLDDAMGKWNRRGVKEALIITDAAGVTGHDLIFQRLKEGEDLRLCVTPDLNSLQSKGLELPSAFAQRRCP